MVYGPGADSSSRRAALTFRSTRLGFKVLENSLHCRGSVTCVPCGGRAHCHGIDLAWTRCDQVHITAMTRQEGV